MLGRRQRTSSKNQTTAKHGTATGCRFYYHRPLGADASCRRLTVQPPPYHHSSHSDALWALPCTLSQLLDEILSTSTTASDNSLTRLEVEGPAEAWQGLHEATWNKICATLRRRSSRLQTLVFYGGGLSPGQRWTLLQALSPSLRTVEIHHCQTQRSSWTQTLHGLAHVTSCAPHLIAVRLYGCAPLSTRQAGADLLHLVLRRPFLRALVLCQTPLVDDYNEEEDGTTNAQHNSPDDTLTAALVLRQLYAAVEDGTAALDEFMVDALRDDTDMRRYLEDCTKLHRMRHYFHHMATRQSHRPSHALLRRRQSTASAHVLPAVTADAALGVVQSWYRATHRPQTCQTMTTHPVAPEYHLSRELSMGNNSTGSC